MGISQLLSRCTTRTKRYRWLLAIGSLAFILLASSFIAAAVLAEGAVHPLLRRRASDTAALAYSIAGAAHSTARKVTIRAEDGVVLSAWWLLPSHPNGRAVMVCHGVADSAYGALGFALLFLRNDYSVLVPDSRGHGESAGIVTYGVLESGDTVQWLRWMKNAGVTDAFGFGESLGGSILIQSLAHHADFEAIVAECPYSSFEAIANERVARAISAPLASVLVKEGIQYIHVRYGIDLSHAGPDVAITDTRVPILLIHGLADYKTSPTNSIRLARKDPAFSRLWLVPGANHTAATPRVPRPSKSGCLAGSSVWGVRPLLSEATVSGYAPSLQEFPSESIAAVIQ